MAYLKIESDDLILTINGDTTRASIADSGVYDLLVYLHDFNSVAGVRSLDIVRTKDGKDTLFSCSWHLNGHLPAVGLTPASRTMSHFITITEDPDNSNPDLRLIVALPANEADLTPTEAKWEHELMKQVVVLHSQWKLNSITVTRKL